MRSLGGGGGRGGSQQVNPGQGSLTGHGVTPVLRIRMDPGFFVDPDPDFKKPGSGYVSFCFNPLVTSRSLLITQEVLTKIDTKLAYIFIELMRSK